MTVQATKQKDEKTYFSRR